MNVSLQRRLGLITVTLLLCGCGGGGSPASPQPAAVPLNASTSTVTVLTNGQPAQAVPVQLYIPPNSADVVAVETTDATGTVTFSKIPPTGKLCVSVNKVYQLSMIEGSECLQPFPANVQLDTDLLAF